MQIHKTQAIIIGEAQPARDLPGTWPFGVLPVFWLNAETSMPALREAIMDFCTAAPVMS